MSTEHPGHLTTNATPMQWVENPEWVNATHEIITPDYTDLTTHPISDGTTTHFTGYPQYAPVGNPAIPPFSHPDYEQALNQLCNQQNTRQASQRARIQELYNDRPPYDQAALQREQYRPAPTPVRPILHQRSVDAEEPRGEL